MAVVDRRISVWRRLRRRAYWVLAGLVIGLGRVLPLSVGRTVGVLLARLGARLRGRDKDLALENVGLAFPDLSSAERHGLLRESVDRLGKLEESQ